MNDYSEEMKKKIVDELLKEITRLNSELNARKSENDTLRRINASLLSLVETYRERLKNKRQAEERYIDRIAAMAKDQKQYEAKIEAKDALIEKYASVLDGIKQLTNSHFA